MKKRYGFLAIIILSTALLGYSLSYYGHVWGDDFALYISQARSLVNGTVQECLANNRWTNNHSTIHIGPDLYPWGFPLLLGPVYYLFGLNLPVMKLYILFFLLLSLAITFLLFRDRLDDGPALLLVAAFAFNPVLIIFTNNILSDIPYLFFSLLAVFLIDGFLVQRRFRLNRPLGLVLTGAAIFAAYFIRTGGIALIPVLLVCQVVEKKRSGLSFRAWIREGKLDILPYVTFLALVFMSSRILPGGGGSQLPYLSSVSAGQISSNIIYYLKLPAEFFGRGYLPAAIYILTFPFMVYGIIKGLKRDYAYVVYALCTMGIYVLWPERQGIRFIFSVLPFYIYFSYLGLLSVPGPPHSTAKEGTREPGIKRNILFFSTSIFIAIYLLVQALASAYPNIKGRVVLEGPFTPAGMEMFDYISRTTDENDTVVFFKPRAMTLLTGRRSFASTDPSQVMAARGAYLVIHKRAGGYLQLYPPGDLFQRFLDVLEPRFENRDFLVYRIRG